jgi:hypothetical protein
MAKKKPVEIVQPPIPVVVEKKTKFSTSSYWAPTPKKFRKIGDALLGAFSITSASTMIMDDKRIAIASLAIGVSGKVFTNFFTEEHVTTPQEEQPNV